MRFVEIDGQEYSVDCCMECPCFDEGVGEYGCFCRHPLRSTTKGRLFSDRRYREGDPYFYFTGFDPFEERFWENCPLREVGE